MTIHKEGYKIVAIGFTGLIIAGLMVYWFLHADYRISWPLYMLLMGIGLFLLFFFRKPNRAFHVDPKAIISPADGKIVIIEKVVEQEYLKEHRIQVSVFMSVFNVHVNWFPVSGRIEYARHHNGHFHVAWHPKSSEQNERTTVVINQGGKKILFRQIAGLIARRIVSYAKVGKEVPQCGQAGFIKFGSRVDLLLPLNSKIAVKKGQKVKGGQTVIAYLAD
ncbi:MAG: phosphatidylserine decarboxylase family protein [Bacteroidales bacterium]|nr:phosphatidylserine decarboxylase family protein [Bacteroidales bacterium]MCL2737853.1 phosphatidylserine decarboxylase family protein [Bacteroidales bacterium]